MQQTQTMTQTNIQSISQPIVLQMPNRDEPIRIPEVLLNTGSNNNNISLTSLAQPISLNERCEGLVKRIRDILRKYASWDDPVSSQLHRWGDEILNIRNGNNITTIVGQKIDKLRKRILENPFERGFPFQNPMLICRKGSLMEQWQLEEYGNLLGFNICPFHSEPLEKIKSHDFAKDLLDWSNEVENLIDGNEESRSVSVSSASSSYVSNVISESALISHSEIESKVSAATSTRLQLIPLTHLSLDERTVLSHFYINEAQKYMVSCYFTGLTEGLREAQSGIREVKRKMEEIVELKVEEFQKEQELSEQNNNARLRTIENNYNSGIETIRSYVRDLEYRMELVRRNNQILLEAAQQEQQRQSQMISSLASSYSEANAQINNLQCDLKKSQRKAKQNQCIIS